MSGLPVSRRGLSVADKDKLDGIAPGATANSPDATLLARTNHTGTQNASTILTTVDTDAAGTRTLALTDAETVQDITAAALVTVPLNSAVAFPTGTKIDLFSETADPVSVVPASGVTLLTESGQGMAQNAMAHLRKLAADKWAMWGSTRQQQVLFLDRFTTPAATVTLPRTCEPLGTLSGVDTTSKLSISGGRLQSSGAVSANDPVIGSGEISRKNGAAFYVKLNPGAAANRIGFRLNSTLSQPNHGYQFSGGALSLYHNTGGVVVGDTFTSGSDYDLLVVLRHQGYLLLIKGGSEYPSWTLFYLENTIAGSAWFRAAISGNYIDDFTILQLYDDFLMDYGIATTHIATPTTGATGTMTPNAFINMTWTPASAEVFELDFRRTSDADTWKIRCDQAAGTIRFVKIEGGVETAYATAAQTWTVGTPATIQLRAVGDNLRSFVSSVAKNTQTGSFNQTATGIKVSGFATGANLAAFPRTLTGSPADEIERQLAWLGLA
jgi:hypothetical protein